MNEDDVPTADNFSFVGPGDAPLMPVFAVDDSLAGWSVDELHAVLHGVPCVAGPQLCVLAAAEPGHPD